MGDMTDDELAMDDRVESSYAEPQTEAGRQLLSAARGPGRHPDEEPFTKFIYLDPDWVLGQILAIEAEAVELADAG